MESHMETNACYELLGVSSGTISILLINYGTDHVHNEFKFFIKTHFIINTKQTGAFIQLKMAAKARTRDMAM